jgi:hypothetical protein
MDEKKVGVIPDISKITVNLAYDIPIMRFFVGWLVIGIIISLAIYVSPQNDPDPISRFVDAATFFLLVAGGGFVAVTTYCQWKTLFIGVIQAEHQAKQAECQTKQMECLVKYAECQNIIERNNAALGILRIWDSANMEKERTHYRELRRLRVSKSDEEMVKLVNEKSDYRDAILDIANYFEDVSLAIDSGVVNEEILASGLRPLLRSVKRTYDPWFKYLYDEDIEYYNQFTPFFNLLERWK